MLLDDQVAFGKGGQSVVFARAAYAATIAEPDVNNLVRNPASSEILNNFQSIFLFQEFLFEFYQKHFS